MRTLCQHCIFKIKENDIQIGCELNRLDKYEKQFIDNHFVLDGYCNHLRNVYWDKIDSPDKIDEVKKECEIKYGVIYHFDGNKELLLETLKSIRGEFEPSDFVVCFDENINVSIAELYLYCQPHFNNICITQSIDDEKNFYNLYETAIQKVKSDYLYFIEPGEKIDKKCLSQLNYLVNVQVKSVYLIVSSSFTMCYKKLFEKYSHLEYPMSKLHNAISENPKLKDTIITW